MATNRLGLGCLLALGILAGSMCTAPAAPVASSDDVDAGMARELQVGLQRSFALPKELAIDADLRGQADSIASAHLARIATLLPGWIQEERKAQAAGTDRQATSSVYFAVWARLLNELALWQIAPGDAAYEQATLATVTGAPRSCQGAGDVRFSDFSSRVVRLQAMAPAMRQAALASERSLLAQWGKPHADIAPFPAELPQVASMAAIGRMQAGGAPPPVALPPTLASSLLAARGGYAQQAWEAKCLLQQWWLRVSLAQGMAPATALAGFRYGTMITADDRMGMLFKPENQDGTPAYPVLASRFQVTGATTITRKVDAAGKVTDVRLSAREVSVKGIRGVRAVAFETIFDDMSRRHAGLPQASGQPGAGLPLYRMVWNLSPTPAESAKGTK